MTVREILRIALGGGIKFETPPPDDEIYAAGAPLPAPELIGSLRQRAAAGEAEAQRELGILTYRGRGVPEDRAEAFKWLTLAVRQGDTKAAESLEYIGPTISVEQAYEGRCRISKLTGEPVPPLPDHDPAGVDAPGYQAPTQEEMYQKAIEAMRSQGLIKTDEEPPRDDGTPVLLTFERPPQPLAPPPPARPVMWAISGGVLLALVGVIGAILFFIGRDQRNIAHVPGQGSYSLQSGSTDKITLTTTVPELRSSAEGGNAKAQFELGLAYARSIGVEQNYERAAELYRQAALQRDIGAMNNLGVCYIQGAGVKQDFVQAYQWLHLAAQGGSSGSGRNRDQIALYMTADQIAEAMKLAAAQRQAWQESGLLRVTPPTTLPSAPPPTLEP